MVWLQVFIFCIPDNVRFHSDDEKLPKECENDLRSAD